MYRIQRRSHGQHVVERRHRFNRRDGIRARYPSHDLMLLVVRRVFDQQLEHEPVDLRFRERVGTLLFNWVLRGQHHERRRQLVRLAAQRDLPLLHRFQQRTLHFGRRTIDFVSKHDIGKKQALDAFRKRPSRAGKPVYRRGRPATGPA